MSVAEHEQKVIKAIQEGSLKDLKRCCIGRADVNRSFCITKDIPVVSKSKKCPFPSIRAPTPLIYTILCEQDELLKYLLEVKRPDLSIKVNGWAPIHYAACTGSHKCLELLLKCEYIQRNIDMPVDEPSGAQRVPNSGTTALHIAATNRRHAAALLLTQDLPFPEYDDNGDKMDDRDSFIEAYMPANPVQMSAYGSMPLHIAVRQRDWDMCQIILHASHDPTVRNSQGKTAKDIAREFKCDDIAKDLDANKLVPIGLLKNI